MSSKEKKESRVIHSDQAGEEIIQALEPSTGEVHLQQYPIFQITTSKPNHNRHTYEERIIAKDGSEVTRRWTVEVSPNYGWPGQHEAEVWRSIEHIIELRARQGILENPFNTTFAEIRSHMPSSDVGGNQWQRIRTSLAVLKNTGVESSFFYRKADTTRQETQFDVIDDFSLAYRYGKNGAPILRQDGSPVIDGVEIRISRHIWSNIENRYIRPIDRGYRAKLGRWSSRRLYEILAARFFARRNKDQRVRLRYSQVCGLLGAKRQEYLSLAKRILGRYHTELIQASPPFLSAVEWFSMPYEDDNDWLLEYYPGPKAIAEWTHEHWQTRHTFQPIFTEGDLESMRLDTEPLWVEDAATVRVQVASDQHVVKTYQDQARQIFAKLTGTEREWDHKDQALLVSLQREGVTLEDLAEGIKACMAEREAAARRKKAPLFQHQPSWRKEPDVDLDPIRTLRYCEAHITEAFRQREKRELEEEERQQRKQEEELARQAYNEAKTKQSAELAQQQDELLSQIAEKMTERGFERLFSGLVLVDETNGELIWRAESPETAQHLRMFYDYLMESTWRAQVTIRPE